MTWPEEINPAQFAYISRLVYRESGISLKPGKETLVCARLSRRIRQLGLNSFDEYLRALDSGASAGEVAEMVDAITTNQTSFFRESEHFKYLKTDILKLLASRAEPIRFWSAGCSTGEEPYSLAVLIRECVPNIDQRDWRILATDISARVLAQARQGVFRPESLTALSESLAVRYFTPAHDRPGFWRLSENVRRLVQFARLNLIGDWPLRGPFDVIFCRNVMIYFDRPVRNALVRRFSALLKPGGHLFIGHSESLANSSGELSLVQPAIYRR
jgi:chemotaxis protein methyltransferase CheR